MENSAEEFGQMIHLYMSVSPDVDTQEVDVTIRFVLEPLHVHRPLVCAFVIFPSVYTLPIISCLGIAGFSSWLIGRFRKPRSELRSDVYPVTTIDFYRSPHVNRCSFLPPVCVGSVICGIS